MRLPRSRGPVSEQVLALLGGQGSDQVDDITVEVDPRRPGGPDVLADADVQLALWCLYELHYRGFDDVAPELEWDPRVIATRNRLEAAFERDVRRAVQDRLDAVADDDEADVADQVTALIDADDSPSLAAFVRRYATADQVLAFLRQRSIYHLKESDPHAFVVPRIDGAAKVALAELQYDEFGGGRVPALHATLFGDALEACGLDRTYGAYLDDADATTLAVNNLMSLFGLNRRLRGAAMGHLAVFEATSSLPSRKIAAGVRRLGLPEELAGYYDEHVEADAVHEQLALRNICGSLVAEDPALRADVLLGAAACLELDARAGAEQLEQWGAAPQAASA